jgi:hypothetical protein
MNKAMYYAATLIGIYLVVSYASGGGQIISAASSGATNIITALQARNRP